MGQGRGGKEGSIWHVGWRLVSDCGVKILSRGGESEGYPVGLGDCRHNNHLCPFYSDGMNLESNDVHAFFSF